MIFFRFWRFEREKKKKRDKPKNDVAPRSARTFRNKHHPRVYFYIRDNILKVFFIKPRFWRSKKKKKKSEKIGKNLCRNDPGEYRSRTSVLESFRNALYIYVRTRNTRVPRRRSSGHTERKILTRFGARQPKTAKFARNNSRPNGGGAATCTGSGVGRMNLGQTRDPDGR